jgi:hypothetical protein
MIKIIDGIRYDTAKATKIGSASNNLPASDFHAWSETLYRAPRSGRFFLAGEGGALSRYGRANERGDRHWGERIIPLTPADARTWCEQNLDCAEWAVHFDSGAIEDA